jgi:hypothetical protein
MVLFVLYAMLLMHIATALSCYVTSVCYVMIYVVHVYMFLCEFSLCTRVGPLCSEIVSVYLVN